MVKRLNPARPMPLVWQQVNNVKSRIKTALFLVAIISSQPSFAGFAEAIESVALERTAHDVRYDGSYRAIKYPGGDVPSNIGVCTDVVIRIYRALGTDLQVLVHEDMAANFDAYPSSEIWGLERPDKNIDHRRVPNLQTFFSRHGEVLELTDDPGAYAVGDLVTWMLPGNLPHIGVVTSKKSPAGNPMVVHNIGSGPKLEDMLFRYEITGHYRFVPEAFKY